MSLFRAFEANDLSQLEGILVNARPLLQKAVESENLQATKILVDAGFGFLPEDTKYPINQEILKLVKPFAWKQKSFQKSAGKLDDVSICPYNDPDFVEEIFKKNDWKKIDYYLLNFAKIQDNVNEAPEYYPENSKFFKFGTLEIIEAKFAHLSKDDKEILYGEGCYSARENERDPRMFILALDSSIYTYDGNIDDMSLICIQEYMKHPKSTESLNHQLIRVMYLFDVWRTHGQRCRWPDIPHCIMIFFEGLGDRLTPKIKKTMELAYLLAKRTRELINKYGRIWFNKWHIKSADPNGNGLLFRKWKESIPTDYVRD